MQQEVLGSAGDSGNKGEKEFLPKDAEATFKGLEEKAKYALKHDNMIEEKAIQLERYLNLRYRGTDRAMFVQQEVDNDNSGDGKGAGRLMSFTESFQKRFRREYGFDL